MGLSPVLSKLVVKQADRKAQGLVDENSIVQMYKAKPHYIDRVISAAYANYNKNNPLEKIRELLGKSTTSLPIGNRECQWSLMLPPDTGFTLRKSPEDIYGQSGTMTNLGANGTEFKFGLDEDPFVVNDVCTPENEIYQFKIRSVVNDGLFYIYTAILVNPNVSFIPSDELAVGRKVIKRFTSVAEYSTEGGKPVVSTDIMLRNSLTTLRQSYAVTRSAATMSNRQDVVQKLTIADPNDPSKTTDYWATLVEWEARKQWMEERTYASLESIYNQGNSLNLTNLVKDDNNRPIYHGAGLLDQISPSNIFTHNGSLVYEVFEDWCTTLAYQISAYGTECELTLFAGLGLRKLITDAVVAYYKSAIPSNILQDKATFMSGSGNELEFKAPFIKTLVLTNNITVKIVDFPFFSDPRFYKQMVAGKNQLLKSYEGFFVNLTSDATGKSNLQKVVREKSENLSWVVEGSFGPNGKSTNPSNSKDGYEIHTLTEENYILKDPIGSARILPTGMKVLR